MLIIDADGHVSESMATMRKYMGPEYQNRPLQESEAWDRSLGGTMGKFNEDPHVQIQDMEAEGIDIQVVFPTVGLSLSRMKETELALARARAYNDWLAEFCAVNPDRLKGVALIALQDVDE